MSVNISPNFLKKTIEEVGSVLGASKTLEIPYSTLYKKIKKLKLKINIPKYKYEPKFLKKLVENAGNLHYAAKQIGITRDALYKQIRKLNLKINPSKMNPIKRSNKYDPEFLKKLVEDTGNVRKAAEKIGISKAALYLQIQKYNLKFDLPKKTFKTMGLKVPPWILSKETKKIFGYLPEDCGPYSKSLVISKCTICRKLNQNTLRQTRKKCNICRRKE